MKRRPRTGALILVTAGLVTAGLAFAWYSAAAVAGSTPRVSGFQAKLFYNTTGTFSPDVLNNPDFWLWNTSIGEGSAESPSTATVVLVEVTGEANGFDLVNRLEFSATYKVPEIGADVSPSVRDVRVEETVGLCGFGPDGKCLLGFWLHDTGCTSVKLHAVISGQPKETGLEDDILFACGE